MQEHARARESAGARHPLHRLSCDQLRRLRVPCRASGQSGAAGVPRPRRPALQHLICPLQRRDGHAVPRVCVRSPAGRPSNCSAVILAALPKAARVGFTGEILHAEPQQKRTMVSTAARAGERIARGNGNEASRALSKPYQEKWAKRGVPRMMRRRFAADRCRFCRSRAGAMSTRGVPGNGSVWRVPRLQSQPRCCHSRAYLFCEQCSSVETCSPGALVSTLLFLVMSVCGVPYCFWLPQAYRQDCL